MSTRTPDVGRSRLKRSAFIALPALFVAFLGWGISAKGQTISAGDTAPNFEAEAFDGKKVSLSEFRGRPVVINFWSSNCITCREEAAALAAAHRRFSPEGLVLIGINSEDLRGDAEEYIDQYNIEFLNVRDPSSRITRGLYGMAKFPETLFIDDEGVVTEKVLGTLSIAEVDSKFRRLIELSR